MSKQNPTVQRNAALANLMARMRQPHELQRIALLLVLLGRLRRGYDVVEPPPTPRVSGGTVPRRHSFHIKKPRSRFL